MAAVFLMLGLLLLAAGGGIAIIGAIVAAVSGLGVLVGLQSVSKLSSPGVESKLRIMRAVWEDAYYCDRDDIVFVPGHTWTGPPTATVAIYRRVAEERMQEDADA